MKAISVTSHMGDNTLVTADIRGHEVTIDQPASGGGKDRGPTPLEYFLFSIGGCINSIARIVAMQTKLDLRSMDVTVSGELDPMVLLGKKDDVRAGFQTITVSATIDADMSDDEKRDFLDLVCKRCPLHDNVKLATELNHGLA
jgi:uncharacterized OsmC-like protein